MDKKQKNIFVSVGIVAAIVIVVTIFARGQNFQGMFRPRSVTPTTAPSITWANFSDSLGAYFSVQYPSTWLVSDAYTAEYYFAAAKSDNSAYFSVAPVGQYDYTPPPSNASKQFTYVGGKKAARFEWKSGDTIYIRYTLSTLPKNWTSANHIDLKGKASDQATLNQMLASLKFVN